MATVPAQIFWAPVRALSIAAARVNPEVCGVLVSNSCERTILTPRSQSGWVSALMKALEQAGFRAPLFVVAAARQWRATPRQVRGIDPGTATGNHRKAHGRDSDALPR